MRLALLMLAFGVACVAHAAETLYATSLRAQTGGTAVVVGNLYTIDPATAKSALVGAIRVEGTPVGIIAIAEHPRTHVLYGLTAGLSDKIPLSIVTIDLARASATIAAPLTTRGSDLGFADDGTLYMWAPDLHRMATVDLASGAVTPVGSAEVKDTAGGGIAIDPHGRTALVAVTGAAGTLDSIDLGTGVATRGPSLSGAPYEAAIDNLTFSPSGELFAVNSDGGAPSHAALVVIDPATGKIRRIGALPDDVRGLIFAAPRKAGETPVSMRTWALIFLGIGAVVVIGYAFKQK